MRNIESKTTNFGPEGYRILPIKIREDVMIYIQDLPYDLTVSECLKICNVIKVHSVKN